MCTGENGTIEGQGNIWWGWFHNKSLNYTRPHLIEFINSTELVISNLTFLNSPFWNIHPVYCRYVLWSMHHNWQLSLPLPFGVLTFLIEDKSEHLFLFLKGKSEHLFWFYLILFHYSRHSKVIVQNLTIRAPYDSPNTDGIDPGENFHFLLD